MNKKTKIYTKTGDSGEASLLCGTRTTKNHLRIEAYGTIDELNSYIGLIRSYKIKKHDFDVLLYIQHRLFEAGSILACEKKTILNKLTKIKEEDILLLEKEMDIMNTDLPVLNSFILPGGDKIVSHCHIARCICRRAERIICAIPQLNEPDKIILKYLNRLSDYLFVLSRKITNENNIIETTWKAKK